nr:uncharacterized protein LOC124808917 [Hydra vulgaris]XP_047128054.1 uncharacterized protein LOC124808917 [Hydra vulgaris]
MKLENQTSDVVCHETPTFSVDSPHEQTTAIELNEMVSTLKERSSTPKNFSCNVAFFEQTESSENNMLVEKNSLPGRHKNSITYPKRCPIPGCFKTVVNLPRHMRSKLPGHNIDSATASKATTIFNLRKEYPKAEITKVPRRKKYYYQCSVNSCFSVVVNISDHFRKNHPQIFNDSERYQVLKSKVTRMLSSQLSEKILTRKSQSSESDFSPESEVELDELSNYSSPKFDLNEELSEESGESDSDFFADSSEEESDNQVECNDNSTLLVLSEFKKYLTRFEGGKKPDKSAQQCFKQVKTIFSCVDPDMSSLNSLFDMTLLRDKWLPWAMTPGRGKVPGRGHLPGTIRSYIGSLIKFIEFIVREKTLPWCGKLNFNFDVNSSILQAIILELRNWSASFNDEVDEREWEIIEENLENIITPEEITKVYHSDTAQEARKLLENVFSEEDVTRESFVLVRDYLASVCCLRNASRAGNCINLTLGEFLNGKVNPNTSDVVINVKAHKTKRKYGPAQIVLSSQIYKHMRLYMNIYRSEVAKRNGEDATITSQSFFVTWSFKKLQGFSKQLDSFWKKALKTNRECPVSATLARKSVTTMFHSKEDITLEKKENLAKHMKHKLETASKHYNLVKNMKSAEGLTNEIDNEIFHSNKVPLPGKCFEPVEGNQTIDIDVTANDSSYKTFKSWTELEVAEVKRLFLNFEFNGLYIPTIRRLINNNELLKHKRPKAIYDKLLSLKKKNLDEGKQGKVIPMSYDDVKHLNRIFKSIVFNNRVVSEKIVKSVLSETPLGMTLLEKYGINRIINKIRYEKNRKNMKKFVGI